MSAPCSRRGLGSRSWRGGALGCSATCRTPRTSLWSPSTHSPRQSTAWGSSTRHARRSQCSRADPARPPVFRLRTRLSPDALIALLCLAGARRLHGLPEALLRRAKGGGGEGDERARVRGQGGARAAGEALACGRVQSLRFM